MAAAPIVVTRESAHRSEWLSLLDRILGSPHFRSAPQLQSLLRYLLLAKLDGNADSLKEYSLGREVFRRGDSYDPRHDAIVRVQASMLRKRLIAFFESEGRDEPYIIELPKGTYVLELKERSAISELALPSETSLASVLGRRLPAWATYVAIILCFAAGWFTKSWANAGRYIVEIDPRASVPLNHFVNASKAAPDIWGDLLSGSHKVVLAFGCPQFFRAGGIYLRDVNLNAAEGGDANARLRTLSEQLGLHLLPAPDTYTGVGEITGTQRLAQFLTMNGVLAEVRNGQNVTKEQLRNTNFILTSSYRFHSVLNLMDLPTYFYPDLSGKGGFRNPSPGSGERELYQTRSSGNVTTSYALVSFWRAAVPANRVLLLSGIDSWSTQGAVDFFTNENSLRELAAMTNRVDWKKARVVQFLLEVEGTESRPNSARLVSYRSL